MISRDNHRYLKSLTREQFTKKFYEYYASAYNEGANDTEATIYRRLFDDFGFADEQIAKLRDGVKSDMDAINQKYITAEEIVNGLISEGLTNLKNIKGEK